jgi:protein-tyrosine phosphatase
MGLFGLFNKKRQGGSLDWLKADIHSHLLPGIDDGSPDIATTIDLIRGMSELGYKKIITTPHVLWDMYQNTTDTIIRKTEEVKEALAAENIDIEFSSAAEYYINEHFSAELKQKTPLLTLKDRLILVEFSMLTAPFDLKDVLFELQLQGYEVLIAHPERYIYLKGNKNFYEELRDSGCQFQLNLLSMTGHYGKSVNELAQYLLENDYYSYAGSDLHNSKHLDILKRACDDGAFAKLEEYGTFKNNEL